jgi:hypothetical protein
MHRPSTKRMDLQERNQRIFILYTRHIHRKRIAAMMHMQYAAVTKVIQKYQGPERREIVRPIESYDVGYRHSER